MDFLLELILSRGCLKRLISTLPTKLKHSRQLSGPSTSSVGHCSKKTRHRSCRLYTFGVVFRPNQLFVQMAFFSKPERPRITIPLQSLDYAMEILAAMGLLTMLVLSALYYNQLPEQIPTHFGPDGRPDAYGSKPTLWLLPGLGALLYAFMTFINRRPDRFNYTVKITAENAERQYSMATRFIRAIKVFVMLLFTFLVWRIIGIAQEEAENMGFWLFPTLMIVILGATLFYLFRSIAMK